MNTSLPRITCNDKLYSRLPTLNYALIVLVAISIVIVYFIAIQTVSLS
jgi:hypothetical protein